MLNLPLSATIRRPNDINPADSAKYPDRRRVYALMLRPPPNEALCIFGERD
jgi:hypothetical protein